MVAKEITRVVKQSKNGEPIVRFDGSRFFVTWMKGETGGVPLVVRSLSSAGIFPRILLYRDERCDSETILSHADAPDPLEAYCKGQAEQFVEEIDVDIW